MAAAKRTFIICNMHDAPGTSCECTLIVIYWKLNTHTLIHGPCWEIEKKMSHIYHKFRQTFYTLNNDVCKCILKCTKSSASSVWLTLKFTAFIATIISWFSMLTNANRIEHGHAAEHIFQYVYLCNVFPVQWHFIYIYIRIWTVSIRNIGYYYFDGCQYTKPYLDLTIFDDKLSVFDCV